MRDLSKALRNAGLVVGIPVVLFVWFLIVDRERVRWLWKTERIDVANKIDDFSDWIVEKCEKVFDFINDNGEKIIDWIADGLGWLPSTLFALLAALLTLVFRGLVFEKPFIDPRGVLRGLPLAVFTFVSFRFVDAMNLWNLFIATFALILVATVVAVAIAIPIGVAAAHHRWVSVIVRPVLDFMQTLPVFVYLLPSLLFFGTGVVAGLFATLIFAIPPGVRLTELGIRQVDKEVVEAAEAFGATKRNLLWGVKVPLAMPSIMQGVNQVIMLALSMVVIAGMVGAGGLGEKVTGAVTQFQVGSGFEGGFAVVVVAIFFDRLTSILRDRSVVEQ